MPDWTWLLELRDRPCNVASIVLRRLNCQRQSGEVAFLSLFVSAQVIPLFSKGSGHFCWWEVLSVKFSLFRAWLQVSNYGKLSIFVVLVQREIRYRGFSPSNRAAFLVP